MPSSAKLQGVTLDSANWTMPYTQPLGNAYLPYAANVVWQDTSSNATYCSVASALGGIA